MRICVENLNEDVALEICDEIVRIINDKCISIRTVSRTIDLFELEHNGYEIVLEDN